MNGQGKRSADMKLISTEGTFLGLARGNLKDRLNVKYKQLKTRVANELSDNKNAENRTSTYSLCHNIIRNRPHYICEPILAKEQYTKRNDRLRAQIHYRQGTLVQVYNKSV